MRALNLLFILVTLLSFNSYATYRELSLNEIESIRLMGHQMNPLKLYMGNMGYNSKVIRDLKKVVEGINKVSTQFSPIKLVVLQDPFTNDFGDDETRRVLTQDNLDLWLRDFGKIAAVKIKGSPKEELMVLDLNRGRGLTHFAKDLALTEDIYYFKAPIQSIAGNYGGNIDVTPNNVLYVGDASSPGLRSLLIGKGYQNRHAILKSNWLRVGHVDEFVSTIILPANQKCRIGIVKASPSKAYLLLRASSENQLKALKPKYPSYYRTLKKLKKFSSRRRRFYERSDYQTNTILRSQSQVSKIIDNNVEILKRAIAKENPECGNPQIIEYPTFYNCHSIDRHGNVGECSSFLPGSVNMTVVRDHLLIPDPLFGPFRNYILKESRSAGQIPHFINDMPYHRGVGEIHCGTNCLYDIDQSWSI